MKKITELFGTFAKIGMREVWDVENASNYLFSPVFNADTHAALAAGAETSATKIIVRVTWTDTTYKATQDFIYVDKFVADVINSYGKTVANEYDLAFAAYLERTPDVDVTDLTVSAVVVSDTGVEIASAGLPFVFTAAE